MERQGPWITRFSLEHPWLLVVGMVALTIILAAGAALPTIWPQTFSLLPPLRVDTDPENMLAADEPVRVFHNQAKKDFNLHDMVVLGIVNEDHADGVFNVDTLGHVYELTQYARLLRGPMIGADEESAGVVEIDLIAPSTVDFVENAGLGTVRFDWLMPRPPQDREQALAVRDRARRIPFLNGTLVADETDEALAIYIPLTEKDLAHRVSVRLELHWTIAALFSDVRSLINDHVPDRSLAGSVTNLGRQLTWYAEDLGSAQEALQALGQLISTGDAGAVHSVVTKLDVPVESTAEKLRNQADVLTERLASGFAEAEWRAEVAGGIEQAAEQFDPSSIVETHHVTGLPVAESTFGVEMFKQMAISAPLAMVVIFILMWVFFKKLTLIIPPMVMAAITAAQTMSLLVISGNTVHIMSSMIPIFIMPIAVLDAIHIISDFFDRYGETRDRKRTMQEVMQTLFVPMLYTSLTTTAGFASLALTPIPPVQVFGLFVGVGVMLAWFWTITFIPAAIMFVPEAKLASLAAHAESEEEAPRGWMSRLLLGVGRMTFRHARVVLALMIAVAAVAGWGISRININDNPTRWFEYDHPIRVADRVLNHHFGGTYMAYLELTATESDQSPEQRREELLATLNEQKQQAESEGIPNAGAVFDELAEMIRSSAEEADDHHALLSRLDTQVNNRLDNAADDRWESWEAAAQFIADRRQDLQIFKQPEVLRYMAELQEALGQVRDSRDNLIVGKSNSLTDIVKTVYRDLMNGEQQYFVVPDSSDAVAQTLLQYQSSHRPQDIDHFVYRDEGDPAQHFRKTSLWFQLTSGDNRHMQRVVDAANAFVADNPPPAGLRHDWFGLTYINVVWQDKMVSGMLQAFLGSFLVVLLMMIMLFRSALWGMLCMVPLTVTVGLIYGLIGIIGKDYDMPVAVLSSLSLGLAVDYAIHFLARSRQNVERHGSWSDAIGPVFGEPARAITRNAIVVGFGFLPLLAAPLVPYQTVGVFIAAILLAAGGATLLILPALITLLRRWLFPVTRTQALACNCGTCVIASVALVAVVAVNIHQFLHESYTHLTWYSLAAVPLLALGCALMSRRESCRVQPAN